MAVYCSRLRIFTQLLAISVVIGLVPSSPFSYNTFAESPSGLTAEDSLPSGAVLRLGTNRFRQEDEVKRVQYSKDGKRLASISRDSVIIWDAHTGKQLRRLRSSHQAEYTQRLSSMSLSPDGEEVAAANGMRVYVWEIETGLQLMDFPITSKSVFRGETHILYSPNGEQLAIAGGASVGIYDTTSGELISELTIENHRASFYGLCWTSDGSRLSAATLDPAVVTWNSETGELVRRFEVQKGRSFSHCPTLSADGKTLVASTANTIHVWEFTSGKHLNDIELEADLFQNIVLTPDNKTLIAGSQDGNIHIVDFETGELKRKIEGGLWIERSMAVSPDFKTVAIGAVYPTIRQWDIETGQEKYPELTSFGHNAEVQCVAYSPDGRLIASGGPNHQINLWDASSGKLIRKLPSESSANHLAFTPSGQQLLTSWSNSGLIRVWDVATGEQLRTVETGMKRVRLFALTPDAKQLIVVASDSKYSWHSPMGEETCRVWDFESGEKLREFTIQTASTESISITADDKTLVTGSANGVIHVLNLETGQEFETLIGHRHSVEGLALNSDGTLLASGSTDQTIRLWDAKTWKSLRVLKGHNRSVTSIAYSPNGRILASGSGTSSYPLSPENSQKIRFWDVRTGKQIGAFTEFNTNTSALAFSPDGQRLVIAHDNTTLLVWDVSRLDGQ